MSLTTWPTLEEQKCGQGTKGQKRDRRSAGRRGEVKCMAACEQEPPVFSLLQIMGQEGKLKEQFQSPKIPENPGMFCKDEGYSLCACSLCVGWKDGVD